MTTQKPKKNLAVHLLAGGVAGCCEALACHPLDTIKVRMQLRGERAVALKKLNSLNSAEAAKVKANFFTVGVQIAKKEGFFALWRGLGAVLGGIVPKMAIRFSSFEFYKDLLANKATGTTNTAGVFLGATCFILAGLGAGVTEAVLVVTPMDVIKIRLQAQRNSMTDPLDIPKYRNAPHCAYLMIKEEGFGSLYKGVTLTALRQCACGPIFNAPLDVIKTRVQRTPSNDPAWKRFSSITVSILKNEGWMAFYKGTTPRVLRVAPGQAITFMVYERVYKWVSEATIKVKETEEVGLSVADNNEV